MATETVASEFLAVDAGYVCGIVQDGIGYRNGEPVITLHMEAYLGAPESYDAVEITGSPALKMKIAGGVHGDIATASIIVNSIPKDPRRPRRGCTRCATCRSRRFSGAVAVAEPKRKQSYDFRLPTEDQGAMDEAQSGAHGDEFGICANRSPRRTGGWWRGFAGRPMRPPSGRAERLVGGADRVARGECVDAVRGDDRRRHRRAAAARRSYSPSGRGRKSLRRFPIGSGARGVAATVRRAAQPRRSRRSRASGAKMARAFDALTLERGRLGIARPSSAPSACTSSVSGRPPMSPATTSRRSGC